MTVYGMTETIASITFTREDETDETLAETVGRFDPGMEVRLADDAGTPASPGEQGEVQVRHSGLFLEYFENPEGTAAAYTADGWFKTGDVGHTHRRRLVAARRANVRHDQVGRV